MTLFVVLVAMLIIIVLAVIIAVISVIVVHNKLVKSRNRVNAQWAQIEVQLARRSDLIPNLIETVRGYAAHEKEIFENVTSARNALKSAASPEQALSANDRLSGRLSSLFAVAEAYPELKANDSFAELRAELKEAEEKIAYARQFYNDTVLIYKDKIGQFPSNIIAKAFGFKDASYFMPDDEKKDDIKINFTR